MRHSKLLSISIRALIILLSISFTACEDESSKLEVDDHLKLSKMYLGFGEFRSSLIEAQNALKVAPGNISAIKLIAQNYIDIGDGSNAVIFLNNVIKKTKQNHYHLLLAEASILQNKFDDALKYLNDFQPATESEKISFHIIMGDIQFHTSQYKQALSSYESALNLDKNNLEAVLGLARTYLAENNVEKSEAMTLLAQQNHPKEIDTQLWTAKLAMYKKDYKTAESVLTRSMAEFERYDTLTLKKYQAISWLADVLVAQGKIEESLVYSNYLSKTRPGMLQAKYKDAINSLKEGDIANAETLFSNILKEAPGHQSSKAVLSIINYRKGDLAQAELYLDQLDLNSESTLDLQKLHAVTKLKLRKFDEAIDILIPLIKNNPDDYSLYTTIGLAYLNSNKVKQALEAYHKAQSLKPDNYEVLNQLAVAYFYNSQTDLALQTLKNALKIEPYNEKSQQLLVSIYASQKNHAKAEQVLTDWVKHKPDDASSNNALGTFYLQSGNLKSASKYLAKALSEKPDDTDLLLKLSAAETKSGDIASAYSRIKAAVAKNQDNIHILDAFIFLADKRNSLDDARNTLQKLTENNPDNTTAAIVYVKLLVISKQTDKATEILNSLLEKHPDLVIAYIIKARIHLQNGETNKAEQAYKIASRLDTSNSLAKVELASLYFKEKKYVEVRNELDIHDTQIKENLNALKLLALTGINQPDPELASQAISSIKQNNRFKYIGYELEGDLHVSQQQNVKAVDAYKIAWANRPSLITTSKLYHAYINNGNVDAALNVWDQFYKSAQKNISLTIQYINAYYQAGKVEQAIHMAEKANQQFPDNAVLLNNMANMYIDMKNPKSIEYARHAYKLMPDNAAIIDTLGWAYSVNKQYADAMSFLTNAAKLAPNEKEIQRHLQVTRELSTKN